MDTTGMVLSEKWIAAHRPGVPGKFCLAEQKDRSSDTRLRREGGGFRSSNPNG
jgi:hypothetical protein